MASATPTDVVIEGESFSLLSIPNAKSRLVQEEKMSILSAVDLESLRDMLGTLGNFMRVAYNGVAGNTEIQIKVQSVGYKITKLVDSSALMVRKFQSASRQVLQDLKGTYQLLLDGLEEMAPESLFRLSKVAEEMTNAAKELTKDYDKAVEDVISVLEDTQRAKGPEPSNKTQSSKAEKELKKMEKNIEKIQKNALDAEAKARELYDKAQKREDEAMIAYGSVFRELISIFTGLTSTAISSVGLKEPARKIQRIGDKSGFVEIMKMANKEKMKHLEEMQKQRDIYRKAIEQFIESAKTIANCTDDNDLSDAAIKALHGSIDALKRISTIIMQQASFWESMKIGFESVGNQNVHDRVSRAVQMYPEAEKRMKVWTSKSFKTSAVQYYAKWVALGDVCNMYMLNIEKTIQDLYSFLEETPTIEVAKNNVRELAGNLLTDLETSHERLVEEEKNALEKKKSLKESK